MWQYDIYRIANDSLALALTREADWFPRGVSWSAEMARTEPPPPLITHLHETERGQLWVYVATADRNWSPDIPDPGSADWLRASFDTMVEVIDVADGAVLADYRSDEYLGGVCGTPLVYAVVPTRDGDVRVQVFDPVVVRGDDQ
jgi:hypothetical protein